jgi:hypothetical protein
MGSKNPPSKISPTKTQNISTKFPDFPNPSVLKNQITCGKDFKIKFPLKFYLVRSKILSVLIEVKNKKM